MTMSPAGRESMQSEINVTPMIDILLVLLIIFMVIVPVVPKGEAALAPQAPSHELRPPEAPVVLEVLAGAGGNADFRINQQAVSPRELSSRLASIFANRSERVLYIKGDDRLNFTQVAEAIDIGHAAGIDRVGLITPRVAQGL